MGVNVVNLDFVVKRGSRLVLVVRGFIARGVVVLVIMVRGPVNGGGVVGGVAGGLVIIVYLLFGHLFSGVGRLGGLLFRSAGDEQSPV